ncbi:hypothetical protein MNBD_GAMMA16-583 [hydrothermal vent metagenome]|uniref:Glycosyltransferase 2-like domain-containing protein n=1 Tax=hydrothermal vent metagenome TaxID=652676 RepID=A0A3B0Z645_9ZZZZ
MSNSNEEVFVSVIIPALNEEEYIAEILQAIHRYPPAENYEIIVVDNGSTDRTLTLAKDNGAKFVKHTQGTIASVRNYGVSVSCGQILIFLDADVLVTEKWATTMPMIIDELIKNPMICTGSRCLPPDNGNWLNRHWFARLVNYDAPYINSGHLITTRTLFDKISGFSEHLKTAEDYDFCMKAKSAGAFMKNNIDLPVIHLGYPKTIKDFINRERWHGREDFETWSSFADSKVGWAAAFNLLFFVTAIFSVIIIVNLYPLVSYFIIILMISIALTAYKFKASDGGSLLPTAAIFYVYLCGRSLALIDRFTNIIYKNKPSKEKIV